MVSVGIAPLLLLVLLSVIIVFSVILASKNGGRALAMLLGACFLAFLFMATLWVSYARVEQVTMKNEHATLGFRRAEAAQARSTEEMWLEMNRPRIPLTSESAPKTAARAETGVRAVTPESDSVSAETSDSASAETVVEDADEAEVLEPAKRPGWVDLPPKRVGNVYREVVVSGRYKRVTECHQDLDKRLRAVVKQRVEHLVGMNHYLKLERLGLSLDYVWSNICHEEWIETVDSSVGEMKRVHVLMEFDAAVDKRLKDAYRSYRRRFRVDEVFAIAAVVLAILVGIYALLKIDTWTRGYYTKRLFFGVPAAIILFVIIANS